MPNLSYRWQQSPHTTREYFAAIPNYRDPTKTISITLESDSSGKVEPTISTYSGQVATFHPTYDTFEDAANAALKAVMKHFRNSRTPSYLLGFLLWDTPSQIARAMRCTDSAVVHWTVNRYRMGRWATTKAAELAGIKGYARGGGEVYCLETPYWETPEYYQDPIVSMRNSYGREKPKPGQRGRPKNLVPTKNTKKMIDKG